MLVLIRNGEVYGPEPQGKKDVLLGAGKIALLEGLLHRHEVESLRPEAETLRPEQGSLQAEEEPLRPE